MSKVTYTRFFKMLETDMESLRVKLWKTRVRTLRAIDDTIAKNNHGGRLCCFDSGCPLAQLAADGRVRYKRRDKGIYRSIYNGATKIIGEHYQSNVSKPWQPHAGEAAKIWEEMSNDERNIALCALRKKYE